MMLPAGRYYVRVKPNWYSSSPLGIRYGLTVSTKRISAIDIASPTASQSTAYMKKGSKLDLDAATSPSLQYSADTVKWSSSNKKVATVSSSGIVKAKKAGSANITAKASSGKKTTFKVKVVSKSKKAKTLKIPQTLSLQKGASRKLKVTITKKSTDTLKWSSSNNGVVSVNKAGKVTTNNRGLAAVTVKSSSGKKATCKVTVR
jgi:uncharacterized protein YjdB